MVASSLQHHLVLEYSILMNSNQLSSEVSYYPIYPNHFYLDFDGGIKIGEMLFRTNIIGFVGTGSNCSYPSNRLILWDDI